MKTVVNGRNAYLDFLKAIAIILVVAGHSIQYGSGSSYLANDLYFENNVFKVIYSFHMPLFMLISGYLFAFSIKKGTLATNILKKMKSLLVPIFIWGLTQPVLSFAQQLYKNQSIIIGDIFKNYMSSTLHSLWFLWAILWCSVCVAIVHHCLKDNIWVYIAGFVLTFFIPDFLNLHLYKYMYPYFVLGYFYEKKGVAYDKFKITRKSLLWISGILYAILMLFYNRDSYIYTTRYFVFAANPVKQTAIDLYRFFVGLVGSIFVILGMEPLYSKFSAKLQHLFSYIGRETMGIYIISGYIFTYILPRITSSLSGINCFALLIETLAVLVFSLLATKVIRKIPFLNCLLFGSK